MVTTSQPILLPQSRSLEYQGARIGLHHVQCVYILAVRLERDRRVPGTSIIGAPFTANLQGADAPKVYYEQSFDYWFELTLVLATQLTGFGLAGASSGLSASGERLTNTHRIMSAVPCMAGIHGLAF